MLPVLAESAEKESPTFFSGSALLNVRADRQYIDTKSKAAIAEGNVSIQLGNAELRAERIEFDADYRTLYARGAVRFQRGSQYFQASSFRYNLIQKVGQLNDVYGVIDLSEPLANPLTNPESAGPTSAADLADMHPVACPPLLPPVPDWWGWDKREQKSAVMPPLPACKQVDGHQGVKSSSLSDRLDSIAFGDGGDPQRHVSIPDTPRQKSISPAQQQDMRADAIAQIDQRVSNLALKGSFSIQPRAGIPTQRSDFSGKNENGFDEIRPDQLSKREKKELLTGTVSRWRVQASKVLITKDGWEAGRMGFSNDPYTPVQMRIDAEDVIARDEGNGDLLISARRNRLIVEERLPVPMIRGLITKNFKSPWAFNIDTQDRDGFFIGRNLKPIQLTRDFTLKMQPQFMVQRAINGETNSYPAQGESANSRDVSQATTTADLFGLKAELNGQTWDWDITLKADISTLNPQNFANGSRYWGSTKKPIELPWIGDATANLFGAYRYRLWNGSLGETDIYSTLGGFIEQRQAFKWGNLSNSYLWRIGVGNYKADSFTSTNLIDNLRANFFGSLTSSFPIWRGETAPLNVQKAYRYSPVAIVPGLRFRTNVNTLLTAYGDGTRQTTLTLSGGPSLTLGTFSKPFLDYTQLSFSGGITLKEGSSPFAFDQAIDLGTLGIGITQQIAGPLVLNAGVGINVDPASEYYKDVIDSNIELRWQRRSYEFGLYVNPYEGIGGFRLTLHDFDFDGTGVPFVPYTPTNWMGTTNADRPF